MEEAEKAKEVARNPAKQPKTYKQPILFLRKSKGGKHLYAFNRDGALGGGVKSLIMDISEVERLLAGSTEWIKVGVLPEDLVGDRE